MWGRELSRQNEQPVQRHKAESDGRGQKKHHRLAQKSELQGRVVEADENCWNSCWPYNHQKAFGFYLRMAEWSWHLLSMKPDLHFNRLLWKKKWIFFFFLKQEKSSWESIVLVQSRHPSQFQKRYDGELKDSVKTNC